MSVNTYQYENYRPGIPQGMPNQVPAVVHKQYNSPMPLYSTENVAEALASQTEVLTNGAVGVNFHAIGTPVLKHSEVYRMVREEEKQTRTVSKSSTPEPTYQSQSFIRIQRTLDETGRPVSPVSPTPPSEATRKAAPASGSAGPPLQSPHGSELQRERYVTPPRTEQQQQPRHVRQQQPQQPPSPQQPYHQQPYHPQQYQQQQQHQHQQAPYQYYQPQQAQPPYHPQQQAPHQRPSDQQSTAPRYRDSEQPIRQHQYNVQQATPPNRPQPQEVPAAPQPAVPYQQQPPPPQQQQPPRQVEREAPSAPRAQQQRPPSPPPAESRAPPEAVHRQRAHQPRYQAAGTGYQAPADMSSSPSTGRRRPVWPPPPTVPALQTSTQSIHWIGSKASKKFVWPPPKAYTSYEYDEAQQYREAPLSRAEAQERADSFVSPSQRALFRSHPRSPARLAAQAWEPYSGAPDEVQNPLRARKPRRTRRFEEVINQSNATRLPPTYRPPPGTQHVILDYEIDSEGEEED